MQNMRRHGGREPQEARRTWFVPDPRHGPALRLTIAQAGPRLSKPDPMPALVQARRFGSSREPAALAQLYLSATPAWSVSVPDSTTGGSG
jgi:hypothetical protein